jgi:hypothetical protein
MRRKGLVARILAVAVGTCSSVFAGSLEPPGPPAPTMLTLSQLGARHNFVGYTTARRNGAVGTGTGLYGSGGIFGMGAVCRAEFPGTRMCTAGDIFNSPPLPPIGSDCAWVDPAGTPYLDGGNCADSITVTPTLSLTDSWQDPDPTNQGSIGTSVAPSTETRFYGGLGPVTCRTLCRIACCTLD